MMFARRNILFDCWANYALRGTITSNQTLGTANKYCTSDIVVNIPQPELVNVLCGRFKDADLSIYIAGYDMYFTSTNLSATKLFVKKYKRY